MTLSMLLLTNLLYPVCGTEFKGPDRKPNRNRKCDRNANGIQNAWSYFPKEAANCCSRPAASEYAVSLKLDFAVMHGALEPVHSAT